ncbi:MAG: hypothetical protein RL600_1053, partial [Actinomycetota bacterium]
MQNSNNSAAAIRQISALINAGLSASQARELCTEALGNLQPLEQKQFEIVWRLATSLGGPIVLALNRITEVFDRTQRNQQEVQLAFAGPQSTA